MILSAAVLIGFGAGLMRARLARTRFCVPHLRMVWLVWLGFFPQWVLFLQPVRSAHLPDTWASLILCTSQAALLVFAWYNRRYIGLRWMGLGLLLNLLVIVSNGGWMPISPRTVQAIYPQAPAEQWQVGQRLGTGKDIVLHPEDTKLELLADRFVLPDWMGYPLAFSLGDVVLAMGVGWLLWSLGSPEAVRRQDDQLKSNSDSRGRIKRAVSRIQPPAVGGGN